MGNFFSVSNWEEGDVMAELEACKKDVGTRPTEEETQGPEQKGAEQEDDKDDKEADTSEPKQSDEIRQECETRIDTEPCPEGEPEEICKARKKSKKVKECLIESSPASVASDATSNPTPPTTGGDPTGGEDDVPSENTFAARLKNDGELLHGGGGKQAKTRRGPRKGRVTRRNGRTAARRKRSVKPTEP